MEYRAHIAEIAAREAGDEVGLVRVVGNLAVDEVVELLGARQVVDGDDVRLAALVQPLTMLLPIKPAAPVTMMVMADSGSVAPLRQRRTIRNK
jgi:hypothetical protein